MMIDFIIRSSVYLTRKIGFLKLISGVKKFKDRFATEVLRQEIGTPYNLHVNTPVRIIGASHIQLHGDVYALSDLRIECVSYYNEMKFDPVLEIGENVSFGQRCHIGCINRILIGNEVLIGSNVLITDHSHGNRDNILPPRLRPLFSKGEVEIGDNTWICDNVCILPGVKIGKNCIIGANTIVNRNIPNESMAVGNPIRIIKIRMDNEIVSL